MTEKQDTKGIHTRTSERPEMPPSTHLAMSGSGFLPTSQPFTRNGEPVRRFLKDMIAVGLYRHPVQGWVLEVTPQPIDRWVAAFRQMRKNGVDVEVVVDHRTDAAATRGYVVDMFRWGDKLYGIHELIGEQAMVLAGRVKNVSVLVEKDFADGKSRKYGEAITHSSIVQRPLVPGQEGFVPIGSSKSEFPKAASLLVYCDKSPQRSELESQEKELLKKLRNVLGTEEQLSADEAVSSVRNRLQELQRENLDLQKKFTESAAKGQSSEGCRSSQRMAASLVDTELLDGLAESAEDRIDTLVERGRITPVVAEGLKHLLVGESDKRNAYALSRRLSGTTESMARGVIRLFEQNTVVQFGEQTAGQYVALCRTVPGETPPPHSPETTREMIDMASGKRRG